uniref:Uncharacterized protein LOC111103621 n=1 Tax=Crassostrea virginica TaxID=6565 RepID=A0A8B8ANF9_CRAVI|nr:uncharacterized protein LOC111103621 [Crassostrea virginica]
MKFFNLKQRAKDKIDQIRRSAKKTGGGPPEVPPLSPSEEVLIQSLEGRPITCSVSGGIDTDDIAIPQTKDENDESSIAFCSSLRRLLLKEDNGIPRRLLQR